MFNGSGTQPSPRASEEKKEDHRWCTAQTKGTTGREKGGGTTKLTKETNGNILFQVRHNRCSTAKRQELVQGTSAAVNKELTKPNKRKDSNQVDQGKKQRDKGAKKKRVYKVRDVEQASTTKGKYG